MPYYKDFEKKPGRGSRREWDAEDGRGERRTASGRYRNSERTDKAGQKSFGGRSQGSKPGWKNGPERPGTRRPAPSGRELPEERKPSGRERNFRKPEPEAAPASRARKPQEPRPGFETSYSREPENLLSGRNPIREALKADRDIEKMLVAKGDLSGSAREIVAMARERGIPVQVVERSRLDEITPHHQGILAYASAYQYAEVEDILNLAKERGEQPFIVVLDGITDPHNLGAIIRTASCAGAHGVIVPLRRSVGLTPAAVKASAGAVETVRVARVTNLTQTLRRLKQEGLWIYAADMSGEDYRSVKLEKPMALVIGSEGEGISRLVLENADFVVKLPLLGAVDSLNASVAAGILMYHASFGA